MKPAESKRVKNKTLKFVHAAAILVFCSASLSHAQQPMSKADSTLSWYKDAKFGMFIHFYLPGDPGTWNPDSLDTDEWVRIAKEAGMKYMVTKAHYNSKVSNRDVTDFLDPFKHPYLNELSESCKAAGLRMGCYYGLKDQRNPLYNEPGVGGDIKPYVEYLHAVIKELCEKYEPILIWFDGSRRFRDPEQKKLLRQQDMVDMLHSYGTLSNSRLGDDDALKFVDYLSMNDNMAPSINLGVPFESAVCMGRSWNYSANDTVKSPKVLIAQLVNIVGNGGNYLLNVGPDHEGVIPKEMQERCETMGQWLKKNGEAIYGTEAGPYRYEINWGSITQRKDKDSTSLYLNVTDWPADGKFTLFGVNNPVLKASLLATGEAIKSESKFDGASGQRVITLDIPKDAPDEYVSVIKLVVSGAVSMDPAYMQLNDGKVIMDTYNATIHDAEYVPGKPTKAIDMRMFTVPNRRPQQPSDYTGPWDYQMYRKPGEGIMPGRGITVSGFQTKGQALSWDFKLYKPGTYEIVINGGGAGKLRAHVAGQSIENSPNSQNRGFGTVQIDAPGTYTFTLEVASDLKNGSRYRSVTLVPVQD